MDDEMRTKYVRKICLINNALEKVFRHQSLRPGQMDVILKCMDGYDVIVLMPTGGGKSLLFQLPAICKTGLAIVISPLVSLMNDQVSSLQKKGINAKFINSRLTHEERNSIMNELQNAPTTPRGKIQLLYITPESIIKNDKLMTILQSLYQSNFINLFVVDEAHCISSWGGDFRPQYQQLHIVREKLPNVPCMALTATATESTVKVIKEHLIMKTNRFHIHKSCFNRPNIFYMVEQKMMMKRQKDIFRMMEIIQKFSTSSGLIYCPTIAGCDKLLDEIQREANNCNNLKNFKCNVYYSTLDDNIKQQRQNDWINGDIHCLICTSAFGMGIDKPGIPCSGFRRSSCFGRLLFCTSTTTTSIICGIGKGLDQIRYRFFANTPSHFCHVGSFDDDSCLEFIIIGFDFQRVGQKQDEDA